MQGLSFWNIQTPVLPQAQPGMKETPVLDEAEWDEASVIWVRGAGASSQQLPPPAPPGDHPLLPQCPRLQRPDGESSGGAAAINSAAEGHGWYLLIHSFHCYRFKEGWCAETPSEVRRAQWMQTSHREIFEGAKMIKWRCQVHLHEMWRWFQ